MTTHHRFPRNRPGRSQAIFFLLGVALCLVLCLVPAGASMSQEPEEAASVLSAQVDGAADEALAQGLRRRYGQIADFQNLEVSVDAGVVTLSGQVLEESSRQEAIALARRVEGVARVQDEIKVVVDPRQRLRPALDQAIERLRVLVSYLPLLAVSLALVFAFFLLSKLVGRLQGVFARISPNRFVQDLLRQAARVAVLVVGVLIALEILDATALVGAVLGTAGVIGLALGFAFRDLVENYISSILLSIRQPFAPDDHVEIDGREGKVVRLTSRATILMTLDGNHLRIPNSQVFKGIVLNYSRNPRRRFDFGVGIGVGEDLSAAQGLGIQALEEMAGVISEPPPTALIEELGDSSVLVRFYGWVDQREASFVKVKSEAIRRVKTVLEDAGMDLPEPIYRLHMVEAAKAEPPEPAAASPAKPEPSPPADIDPDDHLERQIAEDRAESGTAADLLDVAGPAE
jgi:small-conductance mechanosensitive channel